MYEKVFVYGSLKHGFWNNHFLKRATRLGEAHTAGDDYFLYHMGFPAAVLADDYRQAGYHVHGEIYEVDEGTLEDLDMLEGNGHMYERRRVRLSDGTVAWMYLWVSDSRSLHTEVIGVPGRVVSWNGTATADIL